MLAEARTKTGRSCELQVLTNAVVSFSASTDAVFTAALTQQLPDTAERLRDLPCIRRPNGRLALFYPSSRVALAACAVVSCIPPSSWTRTT